MKPKIADRSNTKADAAAVKKKISKLKKGKGTDLESNQGVKELDSTESVAMKGTPKQKKPKKTDPTDPLMPWPKKWKVPKRGTTEYRLMNELMKNSDNWI